MPRRKMALDENGHGPHPVPDHLAQEFMETLAALSEGDRAGPYWMELLEEAAAAFMRRRGVKGDKNDAAHQYLDLVGA